MSHAREKLKSMGRSFMVSAATAAQERLGRDAALTALKIETTRDEYKDVIGKLAYAIVELQDQVVDLRMEISQLREDVGNG